MKKRNSNLFVNSLIILVTLSTLAGLLASCGSNVEISKNSQGLIPGPGPGAGPGVGPNPGSGPGPGPGPGPDPHPGPFTVLGKPVIAFNAMWKPKSFFCSGSDMTSLMNTLGYKFSLSLNQHQAVIAIEKGAKSDEYTFVVQHDFVNNYAQITLAPIKRNCIENNTLKACDSPSVYTANVAYTIYTIPLLNPGKLDMSSVSADPFCQVLDPSNADSRADLRLEPVCTKQ